MLTILSFIAVAAAQPPAVKATPISSLPSREATDEDPGADVEAPAAPEGVAKVRSLLGARHTQDLPSRQALDTHGDAAAALRWIAAYSDSLVEAERAAGLLALYPNQTTEAFCTELLGGEAHPKIRAGAARCMQTQSLVLDGALATLLAAAASSDVRLSTAAVDSLVTTPTGLKAAGDLDRAKLTAEARAHLEAAMMPSAE